MTEKQLETKIKTLLQKNNISYIKIFANAFQGAGLADLLIFNKYICYALELKTDLFRNKPTKIQIATALKHQNNIIYLFCDQWNWNEIINDILKGNHAKLKHLSKKQLEYFKTQL
ncbi:hypothetical protein [[Mycoplasma] gypis]|uniref:VRR-NUC domain-containing protein n=1 Tax=[Mycoplasma] gypis TaxID=92404 RepID=A0ABZ2RR76_9BACT|nr:hypothetical protein [[Mycoplasma] gypis]MBN0919453.1 hypothetical protein [[Mycoplasma] gypis]